MALSAMRKNKKTGSEINNTGCGKQISHPPSRTEVSIASNVIWFCGHSPRMEPDDKRSQQILKLRFNVIQCHVMAPAFNLTVLYFDERKINVLSLTATTRGSSGSRSSRLSTRFQVPRVLSGLRNSTATAGCVNRSVSSVLSKVLRSLSCSDSYPLIAHMAERR